MSIKVAVIGAGNGGVAMCAHMTRCGEEVRICDLFPEYLKALQKEGCIQFKYRGEEYSVKPAMITESLKEALAGVQLILVVTPAFTHRMVAEACADYLEDGQVVVLNPGRTAGALEFLNAIREKGCTKDVVIAETQTLIYSCRRQGGANSVEVYGVKSEVEVSSFPGNRIQDVIALLNNSYPQFKPAGSTLSTSLNNIGAMFHPAPVLMNMGRIESDKDGYLYYWEGISPTVAHLVEKADAERVAIGKAYGVKLMTAFEWIDRCYVTYGDTLYDRIQHNEAYGRIVAPNNRETRFVTDDVPNGLVPIAALGDVVGIETPVIDTLINLAGYTYGHDYWKEGRSLEHLGIAGMSKEQIIHFFETGEKK